MAIIAFAAAVATAVTAAAAALVQAPQHLPTTPHPFSSASEGTGSNVDLLSGKLGIGTDQSDDASSSIRQTERLHTLLRGVGSGSGSASQNLRSLSYQQPRYPSAAPTPTPILPHIDGIDLSRRQESYEAQNTSELPTSATVIHDQPSATSSAMSHQNLLAIMPEFAFSMPAQIVVSGINIALVSVLAVHLLFTVHYHLPLSKANWILQICSAGVLLVSLSVHLHAILKALEDQSHQWPFMFAYLAEGLPPGDGSWTKVQEAFFLLMRAITTVLIHLTHIQFLTLLFPSALEARLILWMLGPLALAAAGMEFTWLSPEEDVKTSDLGDAIRNICNSTLTLLYTCALLIWGGFVNRRRAWRGDGGTAAFGGGAMGLAVINTAMSFVQIRYDRLWWLPDICWTLTIWQSWLGFWWWVGAGMGIGEVEDRAEREARRKKRRERLKRKLEKEDRQRKKAEMTAAAGEEGSDVLNGIRKIKDKITGETSLKDSTLSRRVRTRGSSQPRGEGGDDIELRVITTHDPASDAARRATVEDISPGGVLQDISVEGATPGEQSAQVGEDARTTAGSGSSDTNPTTSAQTGASGWVGRVGEFVDAYQPSFIRRRMRRLRLAHAAAARRAATEQTILRNQVLNANRTPGLRAMMFDREDGHATNSAPHSRRTSAAGPQGGRQPSGHGHQPSRGSSVRHADASAHDGSHDDTTTTGTTTTSGDPSSSVLPTPQSLPFDRRSSVRMQSPSTRASDPFASTAILPGEHGGNAGRNSRTDASSTRARASQDGGGLGISDNEWEEDMQLDEQEAIERPAPTIDAGSGDAATSISNAETARPPAGAVTTPEEERRSWLWRNGLDRVRLRDRQTYD